MTDEKKEWTFHSPHKTEIVYDPIKKTELCEFREHTLTTTDPELAKALKARKYEEWVLYDEDDTIELDTGLRVRLGDLPDGLRKEFVGKPKRAAQSLIERITSLGSKDENLPLPPEDNETEGKHVCPICNSVWDSSAALNGHFAHCKNRNQPEDNAGEKEE